MGDGILPHHREYEEGILGAIILEPALYDAVSAVLHYTDFYVERHQYIFGTIGEMREAGIPVELVSLWQRLEDAGEVDKAGGSCYLMYLSGNAVLAENIGYYAGVVKKDSLDRKAWRSFAEGMKAIEKGEDWGEKLETLNGLAQAETAPAGRRLKPVPAPDLKHALGRRSLPQVHNTAQLGAWSGQEHPRLQHLRLGRDRAAFSRHPVLEAPEIAIRRSGDAGFSHQAQDRAHMRHASP